MSSVSASLTSTRTGLPFRADVQGLRGIAVLLVVLFHVDGLLPGGFIGVDVFFAVSGFLIGRLLLVELDRERRLSLGRFFARRIRRLLPALTVTTAATVMLALVIVPVGPPLRAVLSTAVASSISIANVQLFRETGYFAPDADDNPLLHTWSLSVEEQFYVLLPLVFVTAAAVARRRREHLAPRRLLTGALWIGTAGSLFLSWWFTSGGGAVLGHGGPRLAFYLPFTRAWEFGAGVLLALHWSGSIVGRASRNLVGLVGAGLILAAAATFDASTPFPGIAAAVPVVGTVCVIAGASSAGSVGRLLSRRALTWIGDRSYSWYLWHWPCIVFARILWPGWNGAAAAAAVLSLLPAAASYRFVEERFRRDQTLVGRRVPAFAAVCLAVPLLMATGVALANQQAVQRISVLAAGAEDIFHPPAPEIAPWPTVCLRGGADACSPAQPSAVLVGDSHARALAVGLKAQIESAGFSFGLLSRDGCAFLEGPTTGEGCAEWQQATLDTLLANPPSVVVIHGYTTGRVTRTNSGKLVDYDIISADGHRARNDAEALGLYARGLRAVARSLTDAGIGVVIVSTVPDFERPPLPERSVWSSFFRTAELSWETNDRARSAQRNASVLSTERSLARALPDVIVLDTLPTLCREGCSQMADGVLLYRDEDHLSSAGSRQVGAAVVEAVTALWDGGRARAAAGLRANP